eukprot:s3271_g3.t1
MVKAGQQSMPKLREILLARAKEPAKIHPLDRTPTGPVLPTAARAAPKAPASQKTSLPPLHPAPRAPGNPGRTGKVGPPKPEVTQLPPLQNPRAGKVPAYLKRRQAELAEQRRRAANPPEPKPPPGYRSLCSRRMAVEITVSTLGGPLCAVHSQPDWFGRDLKAAIAELTKTAQSRMKLLYGSRLIRNVDLLTEVLPAEEPTVEILLVRQSYDIDYWLDEISNDYKRLRKAPEELKADRDVVLAAMEQNVQAFKFASDTLRADRDVAMRALAKDISLVDFIDMELWEDRLSQLSMELKSHRQLTMKVLEQQGECLQHAPATLQADREIVLLAARHVSKKSTWNLLGIIGAALHSDKEVVIACAENGCSRMSDLHKAPQLPLSLCLQCRVGIRNRKAKTKTVSREREREVAILAQAASGSRPPDPDRRGPETEWRETWEAAIDLTVTSAAPRAFLPGVLLGDIGGFGAPRQPLAGGERGTLTPATRLRGRPYKGITCRVRFSRRWESLSGV